MIDHRQRSQRYRGQDMTKAAKKEHQRQEKNKKIAQNHECKGDPDRIFIPFPYFWHKDKTAQDRFGDTQLLDFKLILIKTFDFVFFVGCFSSCNSFCILEARMLRHGSSEYNKITRLGHSMFIFAWGYDSIQKGRIRTKLTVQRELWMVWPLDGWYSFWQKHCALQQHVTCNKQRLRMCGSSNKFDTLH